MGYRSDIKLIINSDIDTIKTIYKRLNNDTIKEAFGNDCLSMEELDNGISILKFHAEYVKGYNDYEEVQAVENVINEYSELFDSNSDLGGLHFVGIGEDLTDMGEIVSGDVYQYIQITRYCEFE